MRAYAQAESGGAIDSNVYGIRADLDMDNAVVAGQLFGAYVNVDAESASTLNGSAFGIQLNMDVDGIRKKFRTPAVDIVKDDEAFTKIKNLFKYVNYKNG